VRRFADQVDAHLEEGDGLCFTGDVGTGKTTLAMLVSKSALEAGHSVAIYSLPRLLSEIRTTFGDGAARSHVELLDRLAAVDLLHLDDLGAENTTPWVLEELYSIVNTRYEEKRSVIVTTNLGREELREQIGERTVSRLAEMCLDVPLFGHDRRAERFSAA
jgi:DNA replication protein DnaC